eukprot:XP_019924780.1 PREDICTED: scavenger receptor class F member 1-like [Crassostrea gigas]
MISIAIVFIDLIVLNLILQPEISAKICGDRSTNESHCCPGYRWDKVHENCVPCEVGYYGLNCEDKCPSPYYGHNCKSKCNCTEKNCHHVYGCELYQGDIRNDSTSITYEWRTLIAISTQENQQIKGTNFIIYLKY